MTEEHIFITHGPQWEDTQDIKDFFEYSEKQEDLVSFWKMECKNYSKYFPCGREEYYFELE